MPGSKKLKHQSSLALYSKKTLKGKCHPKYHKEYIGFNGYCRLSKLYIQGKTIHLCITKVMTIRYRKIQFYKTNNKIKITR